MPSITPHPAFTGQTSYAPSIPQHQAVRFGTDESPKDPAAGKPASNLLETLRQTLSQQGFVRGIKDFAGTFGSLLAWNKVLDQADSQSTVVDRFITVFDVASARFRESLLAKSSEAPASPDPVNYALYSNTLIRFPKLVLMEGKTLPLDVVEKAIQASENPENLRTQLEGLRKSYGPDSQVDLPALKKELQGVLQPETASSES